MTHLVLLGDAQSGGMFSGGNLLIYGAVGVMVLMMFMSSRTQKKRAAQRRATLERMKRGDKVVTIGGFFAIIDSVTEDKAVLKMLPDLKVRAEVRLEAIASTVEEEDYEEEDYDDEPEQIEEAESVKDKSDK